MDFCNDTSEIWQVVGNVVTMLKIAIPLIIIVLAIIDLGKAAISSKDDEMKTAFKTLVRRFIAGAVIFFVPTIVTVVFSLVGEFNDSTKADYTICASCISSPNGDTCTAAVKNKVTV